MDPPFYGELYVSGKLNTICALYEAFGRGEIAALPGVLDQRVQWRLQEKCEQGAGAVPALLQFSRRKDREVSAVHGHGTVSTGSF